jgi:beta-glucanase (GH16 family)
MLFHRIIRCIGRTALLLITLSITSVSHISASPAQQSSIGELVWSDEFEGLGTSAPDSMSWNYHVGNGFNSGAGVFDGWGNGELEWYRPENCFLQNGNLVLKATWNSAATRLYNRDWYQFSCRITTDTKHSLTYGAVEARIQAPNNIGAWPAFWMMGDACNDTSTSSYTTPMTTFDRLATNWPSCGEIDILEHRNTETVSVHNLFWDTRIGLFPWSSSKVANNPTNYSVGNISQFHVYRLEWTPTQLRWLVDGNVAKTQDITVSNMEEFRQPFHIILNLALGGAFPNAVPNQAEFPLTMNVDYVRLYQVTPLNSAPFQAVYRTSSPRLTWNTISWATHYQVEVDNTPFFTAPVLYTAILPASQLFTIVTPVLSYGRYYWRLRAQQPNDMWGMWGTTQTFHVDTP